MSEVVTYDVTNAVATVTMNRPDSLNALNEEISVGLQQALARAAADRDVRAVVLAANGRGFSAGADLSDIAPDANGKVPVASILERRYHPIVRTLAAMEKPSIASVQGVAAGAGSSLALACDFRIASDKARFYQAFIKIGLIPDSGGTFFLARLVGLAKAIELSMLGDIVDAAEAERLGLVTRVVAADKLADETRAFAEQLAAGPTVAYGLARRALHFASTATLDQSLDREAELQAVAALTEDNLEGVTAFLQKRAPNFKGR